MHGQSGVMGLRHPVSLLWASGGVPGGCLSEAMPSLCLSGPQTPLNSWSVLEEGTIFQQVYYKCPRQIQPPWMEATRRVELSLCSLPALNDPHHDKPLGNYSVPTNDRGLGFRVQNCPQGGSTWVISVQAG